MTLDIHGLFTPLSVWEGAQWLLIPMCLQWLILCETEARARCLRMALLTPVCLMLYSIVGGALLLAFCAFLIIALLILFFQMDVLTLVSGTVELAAMMFTSEEVLSAFTRLGLCVAGWGLGWAAYSLMYCERGDGYV